MTPTAKQDQFVRMRKLIAGRHMKTAREIKKLSSKMIKTPTSTIREEMLKMEGQKAGLCFSLKVLDKPCQTEMFV